MALPASGQISFSAINTEFGRSSVSNMDASLSGFSSTLGFTAPHNISEFYSQTVCSVEYGTEVIITNGSTEQDRYAPINRVAHSSPNTMSVTLNIYLITYGTSQAYAYYRLNGGSWVSIASRTTAGTTNTTYTINNFDYNDIIDVRTRAIVISNYNNTSSATISSVSWYSGSGNLAKGDNLIQDVTI